MWREVISEYDKEGEGDLRRKERRGQLRIVIQKPSLRKGKGSVRGPSEVHDEWWQSAKLWKSQLQGKGEGEGKDS